jgi:stringent starvation protein B
MTSSRPYLVRAIYQWIVDNNCTPYLLVDALQEGVEVPTAYIENDKIILNISPSATSGMSLENDYIFFSARFSGKSMSISVPMNAVLAIYARENGQGMLFNEEDGGAPPPEPTSKKEEDKRPALKVVK